MSSQATPHVNTTQDIAWIRQRFERIERDIRNIQNNRTPSIPNLRQLPDVKMTEVSNGQVLTYDGSSGLWVPV